MQSARSDSLGPAANDTRGKHRIQAEVKRLEQEARFLEEELEQLDKMERSSAACREILEHVLSNPDPLLPITTRPLNPLWDRWFEGPQESQGCRNITDNSKLATIFLFGSSMEFFMETCLSKEIPNAEAINTLDDGYSLNGTEMHYV